MYSFNVARDENTKHYKCKIKVRNDSCAIPEEFKKNILVCYGKYSEDMEDRNTFRPAELL